MILTFAASRGFIGMRVSGGRCCFFMSERNELDFWGLFFKFLLYFLFFVFRILGVRFFRK